MVLERLQSWYEKQCDGEWEHSFGVAIDTIDNPGWAVKIDVAGTPAAGRTLETSREVSEQDWYRIRCDGKQFVAHGGPASLAAILEEFFQLAEQ